MWGSSRGRGLRSHRSEAGYSGSAVFECITGANCYAEGRLSGCLQSQPCALPALTIISIIISISIIIIIIFAIIIIAIIIIIIIAIIIIIIIIFSSSISVIIMMMMMIIIIIIIVVIIIIIIDVNDLLYGTTLVYTLLYYICYISFTT